MQNHFLAIMHKGYVCLALVGAFSSTTNAQIIGLKWDRDSIVEKEYQASYCQNKPEKASICSDAFSLSQSSSQDIVIDSIFFKVTTPGVISSHAELKLNQRVLKFAFNFSGQAGYPWKLSEYNDSSSAKISVNPFQKVEFSGFEIDNCLFSCPVFQAATQAKFPVMAVLVFVSKNKRDTLNLMGLQSQESSSINRYPKSGAYKLTPTIFKNSWNTNGRRIGSSSSQGNGGSIISFPISSSSH
jgi:hypothetical protein